MARPFGWKCSKETKQKMSISAKKRWGPEQRKKASEYWKRAFRTGIQVPPHQGHSQTENQKRIVSQKLKGVPKTAECRRKIKENWKSLSLQQRYRKSLPGVSAANRRHAIKQELLVCQALADLGISYIYRHIVGKYVVDIFLPDHLIVIECDGKEHQKQATKDRRRDASLSRRGLRVVRLAYKDIEQNLKPLLLNLLVSDPNWRRALDEEEGR